MFQIILLVLVSASHHPHKQVTKATTAAVSAGTVAELLALMATSEKVKKNTINGVTYDEESSAASYTFYHSGNSLAITVRLGVCGRFIVQDLDLDGQIDCWTWIANEESSFQNSDKACAKVIGSSDPKRMDWQAQFNNAVKFALKKLRPKPAKQEIAKA